MRYEFSNVLEVPRGWNKGPLADREPIVERRMPKTGSSTPEHIRLLRERPRLMTVDQVAQYVEQSHWTIRRKIKSGALRVQRIGSAIRVPSFELAKYLEAQDGKAAG